MKFSIKHRDTGSVLFEVEADSFVRAIESAVHLVADLSRADLAEANLSEANLAEANLAEANLAEANLARANLARANLSGANLARANLARANLSEANLAEANLSGANLAGADLSGASGIQPERCTPLLILLDQVGPIRAYKLVTGAFVGAFFGGIKYQLDQVYEVSEPNCDPSQQCGAGINLATLDWCLREWRDGYRILIAEFTAADIACVPTATDGKFRVRRCRIVGEKDVSAFVAVAKEGREGA